MQALRPALAPLRHTKSLVARHLSSSTSQPSPRPLPWFVSPSSQPRSPPPHLPSPSSSLTQTIPPLPSNLPPVLQALHAHLLSSPHLEPSTLQITPPIPTPHGPLLFGSIASGGGGLSKKARGVKRTRGRVDGGRGVLEDVGGGIWNWVVIAQVKEGTEKRGAIESVVRLVRKTLLTMTPPLPLPPNSKRRVGDSWAMIDAGEFAVHILSREAREKFFEDRTRW